MTLFSAFVARPTSLLMSHVTHLSNQKWITTIRYAMTRNIQLKNNMRHLRIRGHYCVFLLEKFNQCVFNVRVTNLDSYF